MKKASRCVQVYTETIHPHNDCMQLPDVGVVLQAKQSVLWVVEDTLLDAELCSRRPTNSGLSRCPVLDGETGTDETNWYRLDASWKRYNVALLFVYLFSRIYVLLFPHVTNGNWKTIHLMLMYSYKTKVIETVSKRSLGTSRTAA